MILYSYLFEYEVRGHTLNKRIEAPNEDAARVDFVLWFNRNFPGISDYEFNYHIIYEDEK